MFSAIKQLFGNQAKRLCRAGHSRIQRIAIPLADTTDGSQQKEASVVMGR
jgi:hypothetical protein